MMKKISHKNCLTKQTGKVLVSKALRDQSGGVNVIKIFQGIDETPAALKLGQIYRWRL